MFVIPQPEAEPGVPTPHWPPDALWVSWDTLSSWPKVTLLNCLLPSTQTPGSLPQHFTNQREEFEGTRESVLVWLTEMDLQLTNVEHFSESDADDKMRQLNVRPAPTAPLGRTHLCRGEPAEHKLHLTP